MIYKFLLTTLLTSFSIGMFASVASAQEPERPECYLIDDSGQLTDLTDICHVTQKRSPDTVTTTNEGTNIVNNNYNIVGSDPLATSLLIDEGVYFGEDNLSGNLDLIDSSYYIDNEIGIDYTAYARRYRVPATSIVRQALRERVFQFDAHPDSVTSILRRGQSRLPFIIYRYQI